MTNAHQKLTEIIASTIPDEITNGTSVNLVKAKAGIHITDLQALANEALGYHKTEIQTLTGERDAAITARTAAEAARATAEGERTAAQNALTTYQANHTHTDLEFNNLQGQLAAAQTEAAKVPGLEQEVTDLETALQTAETTLIQTENERNQYRTALGKPTDAENLAEVNRLKTEAAKVPGLEQQLANANANPAPAQKPNWLARGAAALLIAGASAIAGYCIKGDSPQTAQTTQAQTTAPAQEQEYRPAQWFVEVQVEGDSTNTWHNENSTRVRGSKFEQRSLYFSPRVLGETEARRIILEPQITPYMVENLFAEAAQQNSTNYDPARRERILRAAAQDETLTLAEFGTLTQKLSQNQPLD